MAKVKELRRKKLDFPGRFYDINQEKEGPKTIINWSTLNPEPSCKIKRCIAERRDVQINVDSDSWKKDLPQLCTLLGLKHKASISDVLRILMSSDAFLAKKIAAAGFVPTDSGGTTGTKEVSWEAEEELETGNVRMKIRIPMKYERQLASGNSDVRKKFEKFVKTELSDALKVPHSFLSPEVSIDKIEEGSVLVIVILSASALTLIYVGMKVTQTLTWQEKKFEILMAMGGAAAGSAMGVVAGGPIGAGIGALIGLEAFMTTAWFVERGVRDALERSRAFLIFTGCAIAVIIQHYRQGQNDQTAQE